MILLDLPIEDLIDIRYPPNRRVAQGESATLTR